MNTIEKPPILNLEPTSSTVLKGFLVLIGGRVAGK
jgi:hypothetical protein